MRKTQFMYSVDQALFRVDQIHMKTQVLAETWIFTSDPRVSVRGRPVPMPG